MCVSSPGKVDRANHAVFFRRVNGQLLEACRGRVASMMLCTFLFVHLASCLPLSSLDTFARIFFSWCHKYSSLFTQYNTYKSLFIDTKCS